MNIQLSNQQSFELSEKFAEVILGRVVEMHLWRIGYSRHESTEFNEICQSVRSLTGLDRLSFVGHLRFHFLRIRAERGIDPLWQDFVAKAELAEAAEPIMEAVILGAQAGYQ